jgi:hypothetical protein
MARFQTIISSSPCSSPSLATLFLMAMLVAIAVAALGSGPGNHVAQVPRELPSMLWLTR